MKPVKIGLLGLGQFGVQFFDLLYRHPATRALAICDQDPAKLKRWAEDERYRDKLAPVDCFTSYEDLLRSDVDAVAIFTQPWLHAEQSVQAMEAGKSVYSAVPVVMLPDSDEVLEWCDRLVETVRRTGRHYMLGETSYYRPNTMFARRMTREGAFGNFVHAEGCYLHGFDAPWCDLRKVFQARFAGEPGEAFLASLADYRRRGKQFGPMHYPTHSTCGPISAMNARPLKVSCFGAPPHSDDPYFDTYHEAYGNQTAIFRMDNGCTMVIREHRETPEHAESLYVVGTDALLTPEGRWVDYRNPDQSRKVPVEEMRDPLPEEVLRAYLSIDESDNATAASFANDFTGVFKAHGGSHPYLMHEFVDFVAHDRAPEIDVFKAVRYMAAGAVAHQSAERDGECLPIPDWGDE